uniref:Uncharacterized protein n=1 Tax=Arundo donax TaxID=35708 RepID=A0A0A9E8A1_ARUDO
MVVGVWTCTCARRVQHASAPPHLIFGLVHINHIKTRGEIK